jgi:hypothetical protein
MCEREQRGEGAVSFGKWFTENFSVTVFLIFVKVFTVKPKTFSVDFILLRNKRPKMFYEKRFTSKQTEP